MKATKDFSKNERDRFEALINERGVPCLSILLDLPKSPRPGKHHGELLRKAVKKAASVLDRSKATKEEKNQMIERLSGAIETLDVFTKAPGIGLFVSPNLMETIYFPFEVAEVIKVADAFETRDIYYLRQYQLPFYVLSLSKKSVHLFHGEADSLKEVRDGNLPLGYEEEYEYSKSSRGTSYGYSLKSYEKDKSDLSEIRLKSLFKDVDTYLAPYFRDPDAQLILAGTNKMISDFQAVTKLKDQIIGVVPGSAVGNHFEHLSREAWALCQSFRKQEMKQLIKKADDLGIGYKASGLREVWKAANEGKGHILLVEKDLQARAYLAGDQLYLRPPKGKYSMLPDAIENIIERVHDKKGKVLFVPENQLKKFEGMVLMFRYKN